MSAIQIQQMIDELQRRGYASKTAPQASRVSGHQQQATFRPRLQLTDIDSQRMVIHIRQGKGRKDRYVPLGRHAADAAARLLARRWLSTAARHRNGNQPMTDGNCGCRHGVRFSGRTISRARI